MSNVMDLNLIQTFLVVAEFQSYTKAAEQLGLTQPAVSAAIKRLEQVVDKQLFVKKGRGITLTSAAYQLLPQFEQAVSIIDHAIMEKKHFEVCCSEILLHIMSPIKNAIFYESPPEKYILFELLRQQKVDLVIDTVVTKDAAFVMEEAYEEKAVIICREQHPRIQGTLSKEQFYDETHCLFSGKWNNMSGFEQLAQETILERKVDLVTSSLAGMALYVAQRDCLGLVSQSFANKWSKALKLQVLPCPISICTIPYKFVYHKRELNNPAHIALRERIKTHLAAAHYEPISL
ncbi:TPA: LysR family transcriptional regulator [Vibrio parahaemolyticus]|uniref:LysR family transcriptional regulator n=1 Tax=Vibrio parahaemolyticus TaxID=670 RepID=UPI00112069D1|nr:LysR family transcriptional regulator [Vibrio parahaemolyticus]TOJ18869.1 LysR family transcriptional regulator [Vibrio parahaemolyticus]HAV1512284.1 LysR family transcriptional regulator [Vibrio parahaemolyticus]